MTRTYRHGLPHSEKLAHKQQQRFVLSALLVHHVFLHKGANTSLQVYNFSGAGEKTAHAPARIHLDYEGADWMKGAQYIKGAD